MSEGQIVAQIIKHYYKHPNIFLWRSNSGTFKAFSGCRVVCNFAGIGDISGFRSPSGQAVFIETKDTTKQEPKQAEFQAIAESMGCIYILARSLQDVIDVLGL